MSAYATQCTSTTPTSSPEAWSESDWATPGYTDVFTSDANGVAHSFPIAHTIYTTLITPLQVIADNNKWFQRLMWQLEKSFNGMAQPGGNNGCQATLGLAMFASTANGPGCNKLNCCSTPSRSCACSGKTNRPVTMDDTAVNRLPKLGLHVERPFPSYTLTLTLCPGPPVPDGERTAMAMHLRCVHGPRLPSSTLCNLSATAKIITVITSQGATVSCSSTHRTWPYMYSSCTSPD
jgi:hypothetical protein